MTKDEKEPGENVIPDPIEGHEKFTYLKDLYYESEPEYAARFTVPVLYDKKNKRIVSNESSEILRMLGTEVSLPCYLFSGLLRIKGFMDGR